MYNNYEYEKDMKSRFNKNDELFINASHELKTPLNIIHGAAQLVEHYVNEDINNVEKINAGLDSIKLNSLRLMKIINNLLDLQKIDSGLFKLNNSYFNIVEVVEDVVLCVSDNLKEKNIRFIFDTDAEEKFIMGDTEKIQRMLLNIISNAVKYSIPGGKIYVNVFIKDNYVEIAVIDNGEGIKRKDLNHIFNSVSKLDKSLTRSAEGWGLGLKISKAIVDAHSGSIHVFSRVNQGSAFIIKLPCKKNEGIYNLYSKKIINYDNLSEMIKIEFSDILNMGT